MKFEDALTALRHGASIRHPDFDDDVYLMPCYAGIAGGGFEEAKKNGLSIVLMKGDKIHPDCRKPPVPSINIFLLIADNWEILESSHV